MYKMGMKISYTRSDDYEWRWAVANRASEKETATESTTAESGEDRAETAPDRYFAIANSDTKQLTL
jgi:hypothetical protein